jgi:hypothetical protein
MELNAVALYRRRRLDDEPGRIEPDVRPVARDHVDHGAVKKEFRTTVSVRKQKSRYFNGCLPASTSFLLKASLFAFARAGCT